MLIKDKTREKAVKTRSQEAVLMGRSKIRNNAVARKVTLLRKQMDKAHEEGPSNQSDRSRTNFEAQMDAAAAAV